MNKKGFTLIELIITIGLLSIIGVSIGITLNKTLKNQKEKDIKDYYEIIKSSANLYASNNGDLIKELNSNRGYIVVTLNDIIDAGFLNENTINPNTNEVIDKTERVKISLDNHGTIVIEYPYSEQESYLQTRDIVVELNDSSISTYCYYKLNENELAFVKANGEIDSTYFVAGSNIKCDEISVNVNKMGTYEFKYEYQIEDGKWKQGTRNVIVTDSNEPIITVVNTVDGNLYNGTWTNKNVVSTISYSDVGSGLDYDTLEYCLIKNLITQCTKNGLSEAGNTGFVKTWDTERNDSLAYFKICDKANNCSRTSSFNIKIDKTAPSINVSNRVGNSSYNGSLTSGPVIARIEYSDALSKVNLDTLCWSLNNGTCQTTDFASKTNTEARKEWNDQITSGSVYYEICDNAGNCNKSDNYTLNISDAKPTVKVTVYKYDSTKTNNVGDLLKSAVTYTDDDTLIVDNNWLNYGVTFKFEASGSNSIQSIRWDWNTSGSKVDTGNTYDGGNHEKTTSTVYESLYSSGYRKAKVTVTDTSGNTIIIVVVVKIDTLAPSSPNINLSTDASKIQLSGSVDNITENANIKYYYSTNGTTYTNGAEFNTPSTNGTVIYSYAKDELGNQSETINKTLQISDRINGSYYLYKALEYTITGSYGSCTTSNNTDYETTYCRACPYGGTGMYQCARAAFNCPTGYSNPNTSTGNCSKLQPNYYCPKDGSIEYNNKCYKLT